MAKSSRKQSGRGNCSRRQFLKAGFMGGVGAYAALAVNCRSKRSDFQAATFIASVRNYQENLHQILLRGFKEIGVTKEAISGKRILLKPNLVEPHLGSAHINTHPMVVLAAAEAFAELGASSVVVGEGAGHYRDFYWVLEESGYTDILVKEGIKHIDLNTDAVTAVTNQGDSTQLRAFLFPNEVIKADILVSIAKMKLHHWAGATLSMKNLFGIMPGKYYGWPKNSLHLAGIHESILDINASIKPYLAIVDGIVGMEGDGPIMGTAKEANVLVMGRNFPAVDATCARIMGLNPKKIPYLNSASGLLGPVEEDDIEQRGEVIRAVRTNFKLVKEIPAHQGLRL
ncbi:DUF362 domain-containing protein [Acidobacteriota bacterium]